MLLVFMLPQKRVLTADRKETVRKCKNASGIILGVIVLLVLIVGVGAVLSAGHTGVVVTMGKVSTVCG
ncbi:MAG: hypothetical protein ACLUOF_03845 [Ruminococcus sp.]